MTRKGNRRGRYREFVMLFKEANATEELHANILMMNREMQTQAGVPRTRIQDGTMIDTTVPPRSCKNSHNTSGKTLPGKSKEGASNYKSDSDGRSSSLETNEDYGGSQRQQNESRSKNEGHRGENLREV